MVLAGDVITFRDYDPLSRFLEGWNKPVIFVADREGFEPSIRGYRIHTFQACAFDHSATCPRGPYISGLALLAKGRCLFNFSTL